MTTEQQKPQSTPSAKWREEGEVDPHGNRYNCERASLPLGQFTDDELANGVFLNYNAPLDVQGILDGTSISPITWVTAAKERIRWLSRRLEETQGVQDMLDDARLEIQQLREALKVADEPHQSVSERTLIEAKFGSAMVDLVMSHIDRMGDICDIDTAEQIIESFITKFQPVFDEHLREKWPDREELFRKKDEEYEEKHGTRN